MEAEDSDARRRIEAQQARVTELVQSVKRELGDAETPTGPERRDSSTLGDAGATEASERERDLGLLDDLEAELAELESALRRIDDGVPDVEVPRSS